MLTGSLSHSNLPSYSSEDDTVHSGILSWLEELEGVALLEQVPFFMLHLFNSVKL